MKNSQGTLGDCRDGVRPAAVMPVFTQLFQSNCGVVWALGPRVYGLD